MAEQRTEIVNFRITQTDKNAIQNIIEKENISISEFYREAGRAKIEHYIKYLVEQKFRADYAKEKNIPVSEVRRDKDFLAFIGKQDYLTAWGEVKEELRKSNEKSTTRNI